MQLRCTYCHKPFAISKEQAKDALETIDEQKQNHYNIHCPHCRKANRISRPELQRGAAVAGEKSS